MEVKARQVHSGRFDAVNRRALMHSRTIFSPFNNTPAGNPDLNEFLN